jgi:ATP-dependent exoDNAse (exonuclease V) beta subunit
MHLSEQIEVFFNDLEFEEHSHTYRVKGEILPSVSFLIKQVTPPFDEQEISKKVSLRDNRPRAEVLTEWKEIRDEACDRGKRVHNFAEEYAFDRELKPTCPQEKAAKKFWDQMPAHIVPMFVELKMYHKLFRYAGTTDLVLFDRNTGMFILADYKTNKDLFKNFNKQRLLFPFNNMLATPYSKYALQLSYYQILFEQTGFKVSHRKLIYLDMDGGYGIYDLNDYTNVLTAELLKRN